LAFACRIGEIGRFPTPRSLANYWGLTPRCGSSDDTERLGSIKKEGSPLARYLLGQMVLHILRKDDAGVVPPHQAAARCQDRAGGRHAPLAADRGRM